jgi:predicted GIY-YIG superfamily endonuclease
MAYKTEELEEQALKAIKEHGLVFIEEVVSFLPCDKTTFYAHGLSKSLKIKEALKANKVKVSEERKGLKRVQSKYKKGSGYVYLIKCEGVNYYKIGISKSTPKNRLSNLQSGCPFKLDYVTIVHCDHYSLIEAQLHRKYRDKNIRGEWFELSPTDLIDVIEFLNEKSTKQITLF